MKSLEEAIKLLKSKTNYTNVVALKSIIEDLTRVPQDESSIDDVRYSYVYPQIPWQIYNNTNLNKPKIPKLTT